VKAALVVTTVGDGVVLDGYLENFARYGHEVTILAIPDEKTPGHPRHEELFVPLAEQDEFLRKVGFGPEEVPRNSDNRRNVGYLMALASGADFIISIDDDNYCSDEDQSFIGAHSVVLGLSESTWFNCIGGDLFPRGFPYAQRKEQYPSNSVRINAGMWLGDPDLDAVTWMTNPHAISTSLTESHELLPNEWCPINSQNTAVHREAMTAFYFLRMGHGIDRFGDIFQGYFALKVAKHLGFTARFGTPVVDHRRNSHNYIEDAVKEIQGIKLLEEFLPRFLEWKLTGSTWHEAYLSLADYVEREEHPMLRENARRMKLWAKVCQSLG
jgi:hypothetical protein